MLNESPLYAVIPVSDLQEARRFYEEECRVDQYRNSLGALEGA